MAVQAQYPSNVLVPHFRNRAPRQSFGGDNRSVITPGSFHPNSFVDEFHLQNAGSAQVTQMRLFTPLGIPSHSHQQTMNPSLYTEPENDLACNLLGSRKRPRETDELLSNAKHQLLTVTEFHQNHATGSVILPQSNSVSTGLRLAFDDDRMNSAASSPSTSGRGEVTTSLFSVVGDELSSQLIQQKEEIDQFFKSQSEQARQLLEEKRVRHSRALIAAIEDSVSRKLREKDLEMEKIKRRNMELEEHARKVSLELHIWQTKLKTSEAQVLALRSNLQQAQQAVQLSREQSKEGCGDSEADDAASSHHGNDSQARAFRGDKEQKEQRTCKVCRSNDISMLLLPCRHLCLCKDCETRLINCPLCQAPKNASVQVYMS
ncbi:hypothetical protein R1sor_012595 [Riccia sorocarpa]|uniref:RING-type domain-containing protein n=1 Tax=Riccia sorocarpa TaxID=122646 RepID=A0ABD3I7H3_9MARC